MCSRNALDAVVVVGIYVNYGVVWMCAVDGTFSEGATCRCDVSMFRFVRFVVLEFYGGLRGGTPWISTRRVLYGVTGLC